MHDASDIALYSKTIINMVWKKGFQIHNYSATIWRYDIIGKPISYREYNNRNSRYGWVIDIIDTTRTNRERFAIDNLQPVSMASLDVLAREREDANRSAV